jgi:hypothetical protein
MNNTQKAEAIADLGNMTMQLAETIESITGEEFHFMVLLDAMAIHGYKLVESFDYNIASDAYMYGLHVASKE